MNNTSLPSAKNLGEGNVFSRVYLYTAGPHGATTWACSNLFHCTPTIQAAPRPSLALPPPYRNPALALFSPTPPPRHVQIFLLRPHHTWQKSLQGISYVITIKEIVIQIFKITSVCTSVYSLLLIYTGGALINNSEASQSICHPFCHQDFRKHNSSSWLRTQWSYVLLEAVVCFVSGICRANLTHHYSF